MTFYDKVGNERGCQEFNDQNSIPPFAKVNIDAYSADEDGECNILGTGGKGDNMAVGAFGYYLDGSFGGAVLIEVTSAQGEIIAINRCQHPGAGEDVNAVFVP